MFYEELEKYQVHQLYILAEKYALRKNMDVDAYLDGVFYGMLHDDDLTMNISSMVNKLIEYHLNWLRDCEKNA